jgi:Fic family protein
MMEALYAVENYLHSNGDTPVLVKAARSHAQFETIHPFLDGNGRVERGDWELAFFLRGIAHTADEAKDLECAVRAPLPRCTQSEQQLG